MSHMQLSRTRPIPLAWQDISDEQNDAQTAAIFAVIAEHHGDVKVVSFSPSEHVLISVIEYPDEGAAKRSVAEIMALNTLEFVSIEALWDVIEWVGMVRAANAKA